MKRSMISVAAIAACSASSMAGAQNMSNAVRQDVQCFAIYASITGQVKDERQRAIARIGTMYYLGRIDARSPGLNLAQALRQVVPALQANAKTIGPACEAQLKQRGQAMAQLGGALRKR